MNELTTIDPKNPSTAPIASPLAILQAAVTGGITSENVAVVKELAAMCREQRAEDAKAEFARAFFQLKRDMPVIYADKEVRTKSGTLAFEYCSPQEIQDTIDPLMKRHGFCTMTGQTKDPNGFVTATVTLFHEGGHSETRGFTVRPGSGNALMSEAQCDAGATTSAERHLLIKMLGLRTRLRAEDDARNVGSPITQSEADELRELCDDTKSDRAKFLAHAGAATFEEIPSSRLNDLTETLNRRAKK